MRDIRSPALKSFWMNLKEVGTIMSLFIVDEFSPKQNLINESLARSSLVLLCSYVENFFESLVVDILGFHEFNQTAMKQLPEKLRVTQILQSTELLDKPYSGDKWKLMNKIRTSKFIDDRERCSSGDFRVELVTKGFASPGSRETEDLFKGIGIEDIWKSSIGCYDSNQVKRSLDAFISRRNNIAHGSSADRPTPSDIQGFVRDVCKLVRYFNLVVTEYLIHVFNPPALWGCDLLEEEK
jgi:RiboL-PSP-HEPN